MTSVLVSEPFTIGLNLFFAHNSETGGGESFIIHHPMYICPKYGQIQTGMYFFSIHRRPGTMDNECE